MRNDLNNDRVDNDSLIDITFIIDDMWKEFLKLWWLALLIVSVASSVVYFYTKLTWVPKYVASATYTVEAQVGYGYNESYYNRATATNLGTTLQYMMTSITMETLIAEDLGVSEVPGDISVSNTEGTNLITISVTATNPTAAYQVLQSVIKNYPSVSQYVIGNTVLEILDETGVPAAASNQENAKGNAKKGFVAGAFVALLLLFLLAVTKHTIKKEEDFQRILNVKCYGAIPRAKFKKRGKKSGEDANRVMINNTRIPGGFIESVRSIRSKFEQDAVKNGYKVILVSSSIAGEGKSTVSANLALSLSKKGKSVILVDLDLRSSSIAERLYLSEPKQGTIDVLEKKCTLEEALIPYKYNGLRLLPGGRPVLQSKRILNQPVLREMINQLREMADYVILDTPPCAIVSDAMSIAKYADTAVFVVRQDYARVTDIIEGVQNLHDQEMPICGCVLNNAEVGITGYGYSQSYGYGRYGYGYGDKKYGYGYGGYGYGKEDNGVKYEKEEDGL